MKTPTTVLLVVIAALLAANIIVNLRPQEATAQAQPPPFPPPVDDSPRLAGISVVRSGSSTLHFHVLRLWSDGVVEYRQAVEGGLALGFPPNTDWAEIP